MAQLILDDCYFEVNSVDLSDHVKSVTVNYSGEMQDDTVMGDDTRSNAAGLKNWSMDVQFVQDFAAGEVDATLFSLVGAAAFTVEVRPTSGGRSATNPGFNGNAVLESYQPVAGAVGDLLQAPVTFQAAGTLSRSTS